MTQPKKKIRVAEVISDKMNKTRVVKLERKFAHRQYGKVVKKTTTFKVHDEKNEAKVGDKIKIMETRPLSKDKHWQLVEIIERAK